MEVEPSGLRTSHESVLHVKCDSATSDRTPGRTTKLMLALAAWARGLERQLRALWCPATQGATFKAGARKP
eukprot:1181357-Rhodomonas_salina.1